MQSEKLGRLVVAITSRTLFDFSECNRIYESEGIEAYERYQRLHENDPLDKGVAYGFIKKLLDINKRMDACIFEVILVSRNSADTGLRVFNSIEHYGLDITRAAFTDGESPYLYLNAFGVHLFLSASDKDVKAALEAGLAAATIIPEAAQSSPESHLESQQDEQANLELRVAFDGDAVLFSDEAERIARTKGLEAVRENERLNADIPLPQGPFHRFLKSFSEIQKEFGPNPPLRTALVTARSAPSHKRVVNTLRAWGIKIDESFFLGGIAKGEVLSAFKADVFFDDTPYNCEQSGKFVTTGHVPYGIANEQNQQ